jgi:hypothetical protein
MEVFSPMTVFAGPAGFPSTTGSPAAPEWRSFLRALVETLDLHLDRASRDRLLRTVGARMAVLNPLPPCTDLAELEARMNAALAAIAWGRVELAVDSQAPSLVMMHLGAPMIATSGNPGNSWIMPVLEGLHGTWLAGQPGADPAMAIQASHGDGGLIRLCYGRGQPAA